jgi:hypothetical protein
MVLKEIKGGVKYELCKRCLNCFYINKFDNSSCIGCGYILIQAKPDDLFERRLVEGERITEENIKLYKE